ncbi:hypothetical protein GCM10025866_11900 [Naasia aerilata]|uniref:Uncharacterized protein n=1 Tax=Naasia aerilata TaxID=1162966 RepID=A0ABN6XKD1_9MICO|nr:hypothetical protein GCM10025866_11900 [Naasia aerilata]
MLDGPDQGGVGAERVEDADGHGARGDRQDDAVARREDLPLRCGERGGQAVPRIEQADGAPVPTSMRVALGDRLPETATPRVPPPDAATASRHRRPCGSGPTQLTASADAPVPAAAATMWAIPPMPGSGETIGRSRMLVASTPRNAVTKVLKSRLA